MVTKTSGSKQGFIFKIVDLIKLAVLSIGIVTTSAFMSFLFLAIPIGVILGLTIQNENIVRTTMVIVVVVSTIVSVALIVRDS